MHVIDVRNVGEALLAGARLLSEEGETEKSRDGDVIVAPFPVATVYAQPTERVLLDPRRDANPFFHIMEAAWMLEGQDDAKLLDRYVKNFSTRYGEDNGHMHGAYGFRWRRHFDIEGGGVPRFPDQLKVVVDMLRENPSNRRIVLTMWDPVADLGTTAKDIPCNTQIYFRVWRGILNMTVCCRSNDMVMGAYGANAVHMSVLQEAVATLAGLEVGVYTQMSNNFHMYQRDIDKLPEVESEHHQSYALGKITAAPLFSGWLREVSDLDRCSDMGVFAEVRAAHDAWRESRDPSLCDKISAPDWRLACQEWCARRLAK
jgi:thymidylate synthase